MSVIIFLCGLFCIIYFIFRCFPVYLMQTCYYFIKFVHFYIFSNLHIYKKYIHSLEKKKVSHTHMYTRIVCKREWKKKEGEGKRVKEWKGESGRVREQEIKKTGERKSERKKKEWKEERKKERRVERGTCARVYMCMWFIYRASHSTRAYFKFLDILNNNKSLHGFTVLRNIPYSGNIFVICMCPANILFMGCYQRGTNPSGTVMSKPGPTVSLVDLQCKPKLKNIFWNQIEDNLEQIWQ